MMRGWRKGEEQWRGESQRENWEQEEEVERYDLL
jgi:hypothetical protein